MGAKSPGIAGGFGLRAENRDGFMPPLLCYRKRTANNRMQK